MSHNYGFDNPQDRFTMNFFIIKEVYRYMAGSIDDIIDAMRKFYDYLDIDENGYDNLATTNFDSIKKVKPLLIECGFPESIFRPDSPTTIEMSDNLFNMTYEYLFKNKNNNILFEDFTNFLQAEIKSIYDTKNALLVVSVRRLISRIYALSQNTIDEFIRSEIQENIEPEIRVNQQANRENLSAKKIRATNYFVIREVYKYMALIDKIEKPMKKFYKYLGITDDGYGVIMTQGYCSDKVNQKLIECGFSDTFFSKDSPILINMSDSLYHNIFKPKKFKECLKTEIGTIYDSDNKLLVEPVRDLIFKIQTFTKYVDDDFIDILDSFDSFDYKNDPHNKKTILINEIVDTYKDYVVKKENSQNTDK